MIIAFDVHYRDDFAKAVGFGFHKWSDEEEDAIFIAFTKMTADYEPGAFYKRELPCLLTLLKQIDIARITCLIVDGYVLLDNNGTRGLGGHLYEYLEEKIPVIGIAKKSFAGNTYYVREVFRGKSDNPLYVTALGIPLDLAAEYVRSMYGPYRIPSLLKRLDDETKT